MGPGTQGGVSWVPGAGTCCWGAVTGHGCDESATRIAWQEDVIDVDPVPRTGVVAIPVCLEHGHLSREWHIIDTREAWIGLQEDNPARVWLVESLSPVR
jgi:hypothetical protein